jgi:gliding motility-associated-like protein
MNLKKIILFFTLIFSANFLFATHNRSGEITYQWIGGNQYKIRVTTYTNYETGSAPADRCEQTVYISTLAGFILDSLEAPRVNGPSTLCSASQNGARDGEILDPGTNKFKKNIYEVVYTFNSGATYIIYMFDPNRNGGIVNIIGDSQQQPFALTDTLKTFNIPGLTVNSTPTLLNPPIDEACVGRPFIHNPGAFDSNGDSLSYNLSIIFGEFAQPIPGYIPAQNYGITINSVTGDFYWPNPTITGEFNFGILITEWRKTADGDYVRVGSVLRDLQINVVVCNNNPPVVANIPDTCILAGTDYMQLISATDPDNNMIDLTVTGGPFSLNPAPTFTYSSIPGSANGAMNWTPPCNAVRNQPYLITVKASDIPSTGETSLTDFESFFIRVVAPPPQNLTANPVGSSVLITWNPPAICTQTSGNIIVSYKIYRKVGCAPIAPTICEPGVADAWGFSQIGTVNAIGVTNPNYSFTDNSNLVQGIDYSYIVVAVFADGSSSLAPAIVCVKLVRDVPLLTNVSVDTTDNSVGKVFVRWVKPLVKNLTVNGLDTIANPGPYEFRLLQGTGVTGVPTVVIYSATQAYFAQLINLSDTTFTSLNLNTDVNAYNYKLDFYSNGNLIGSSQKASSVRLMATGLAKRVELNWTASTPWTNNTYYIYKQNSSLNYILIDSTSSLSYTDTGLVNGATYCYKVKSKGGYNDPNILNPLENWSQKTCTSPVDKEAPCQPSITADGDCNTQITQITWTNGAANCSYDILYYNLYYTAIKDSQYVKIDSFSNNINSFTTDYANSIAGCYAVTAVDSFGNESAIINEFCVDNCPEYELPNIITINGDSINDFFIPIKNRFVKDIELKVYNRWGSLMFETTDPAIHWDGKNKQSGLPCVSGTYYYICEVHMIRYTGIETKKLKGFVQILKN